MQENFPYRAKVLITQRRYQEAIQICRDGLRANPDHVEGKVLLGMALLALRQYEQVLKEIEPLLGVDSEHAVVHRLLGEAHLRLGHTAHARQHLEEAQKAQPDSSATLELLEELERGADSENRRSWADPNDTITVSNRTPLMSDDDEQTATTTEASPMVMSRGKRNVEDEKTAPLAAELDSLPDFDGDDIDETLVGDLPSMGDLGKGAGEEKRRAPLHEEEGELDEETAAIVMNDGVSSSSSMVEESDFELEEETAAIDMSEEAASSSQLVEMGLAEENLDAETWDAEDQTIATVLPEYREGLNLPSTERSGQSSTSQVLSGPSVIVGSSIDEAGDELEDDENATKPISILTGIEEIGAELGGPPTTQEGARVEGEGKAGRAAEAKKPPAPPIGEREESLGSVDFKLDPDGYNESPFRARFDVSHSVAQSLEKPRSEESIPPEGRAPAESSSSPATSSAPKSSSPPAPPPVPMGKPDQDATRVLDAASAAIIRAQSGAPFSVKKAEVKDSSDSRDQLMGFTEEPLRDLEGTDSFSALAEGTMVDEESLAEVRERIAADKDRSVDRSGLLERDSPVSSDEIEGPKALSLDDFDEEVVAEPGGKGGSHQDSVDVSTERDREAKEGRSEGAQASSAPSSSASSIGGAPAVADKALASSRPSTLGRDPAVSTAVLAGGEKEKRSDGSVLPPKLPEGLVNDDDADQVTAFEGGGGKGNPGRAKFIENTTSPTALAVPAYKPGESSQESTGKQESSSPPLKSPAKKKTLLGFGAKAPKSDPLASPLDPGDFPRQAPSLPKIETSIPLSTDDLMINESEVVEVESPPQAAPQRSDSDPLEEPFRPEDFSSHKIPLPGSRRGPDAFDLDKPLSPDDFGLAKSTSPVRPLPPVSPLDQPISPDDFTPGPKPKSDLADPLNEPFWPEDFEEGGKAELRAKAFKFGRTQAPETPSGNLASLGDDDQATSAIDTKGVLPKYKPSSPPQPPSPPQASAPPPPPPPPPIIKSAPPPPPPPAAPSSPPERPLQSAVPTRGDYPPPPPPDFTPAIPKESPVENMGRPRESQQPLGGQLEQPRRRKVTEPINTPARDPFVEPERSRSPEPKPPPRRSVPPPAENRGSRRPSGDKAAPELQPKPVKKRGGLGIFIGIGALLLLLLAGIVVGVVFYLGSAEVEERRTEAQAMLLQGNYRDYSDAARIYDILLESDGDDPALLSEAARVHAITALEFGTDDDDEAEAMLERAKAAGAEDQQLAPALAAINIYRGELVNADKVLNATKTSTGDDAPELIYLRGLWYLRQDDPREALRRFSAASETNPRDVRMVLAQAKALYAQGGLRAAMQKLDEVEGLSAKNVASRLLRAKINIEAGRHPEGGDAAAREVLEGLSSEASPGQLGWAKLLRARYFVQTKKNLQARDNAVSARDSRPAHDPEFSALLARTLLDLNDAAGAQQEAKRAVELSPNLQRYRLLLAESLLEVDELEGAQEQLKAVKNSPKAALLQGRIHLAREELESAERRFEEAAQGEREAPQAKLYLARIHLKQNRTERAIELLKGLAQGPPERPEARILLGEAYLTTNNLEKAQAALEQASEALPSDPRVSINLGKLYARQGELDKAISSVQKALTIEPNQPEALLTLGELQLRSGDVAQAAETYDKAIKARPSSSNALIGRARVATAQREFDTADQLLDKAADGAQRGLVELARGELLLRQYLPEKAIGQLEKAVEAFPNNPTASALLGDAYVMQGDRSNQSRARSSYNKALQLQDGFPRARIGLAELALLGTNISRAKRSIDAAIDVAEDRSLTDSLRARIAVLKGRYQFEIKGDSSASRDHLVKALDLDENLAEAHLSLGFVYEDLSRGRDACRHFRRYLELAENGPRLDVAEARRGQRDNCR